MKWINELSLFEAEKRRKELHIWALLSVIISFIYFISGWLIYSISNVAGIFVVSSSIFMVILGLSLVLKRDIFSIMIYLKSKEEK